MHGDRFRRPAVLQYGHTLTRATAVIGGKRRSSNYWRPARAGCPPIDSRAVRCSLAPMALPLLWGPQGQRAGLGTRGLGVLYTGYGNKVKVGRYQSSSSRMPFVFFFLIWPVSIQPACLWAKFAPDTILDGVWRCWGVDWTLLRYSSDKVMC